MRRPGSGFLDFSIIFKTRLNDARDQLVQELTLLRGQPSQHPIIAAVGFEKNPI
jgi:hypothetical protein